MIDPIEQEKGNGEGPEAPLRSHSGAAAAAQIGIRLDDNTSNTLSDTNDAAFDPAKAMAEILANGPRAGALGGAALNKASLTFDQRCAIFAAARQATVRDKDGKDFLTIQIGVLARAFAISSPTAGQIVNCLNVHGKYRAVAREYRMLGEEQFIKRYFTQETRDKLMKAQRDKTRPNAKRYAYETFGPILHQSALQGELQFGIFWSNAGDPEKQMAWRIAWMADGEPGMWLPSGFYTSPMAMEHLGKLFEKKHFG